MQYSLEYSSSGSRASWPSSASRSRSAMVGCALGVSSVGCGRDGALQSWNSLPVGDLGMPGASLGRGDEAQLRLLAASARAYVCVCQGQGRASVGVEAVPHV
jgi:hypothetical protein